LVEVIETEALTQKAPGFRIMQRTAPEEGIDPGPGEKLGHQSITKLAMMA
jgi:hypothetical protein